jgi:hypothetical protein
MPEWIITIMEILKAITPLIIGAGVIYIARQQHKTNKDRLKMELFDRRYKIYEALAELLTTDTITTDDLRKYRINVVAPAQFVFKRDVQDALAEVDDIADEIAVLIKNYFALHATINPHDSVYLMKNVPGLADLYKNLDKAEKIATMFFAEYITLKL